MPATNERMYFMKTKRDLKKQKDVWILLLIVTVVLGLCSGGICSSKKKAFVYKESLEDVVLSVDDKPVTLREFGYYIISVEEYVNRQAILYDAKQPSVYWGKHFRNGIQSTFISSKAKKTAYNTCICDRIYLGMAKEAGYELLDEEKEKALQMAEKFWKERKREQIEKTGLTFELVSTICENKVLIGKFAKDYVKTVDFEGYAGYREELISADGEYYEKEIKPKHKVNIDARIRSGLKFGKITVNMTEEKKEE